MMNNTIRTATPADEPVIINIIVLAFAMDPMVRWTWPDPSLYLGNMPDLIHAFGGGAFVQRSAHITHDQRGAALWLPPDTHPDEEKLGLLIESTVAGPQQQEVFMVLEQMGDFRPDVPHWYLPLIAVDPTHHGKGHGSSLMKHALEQCDKDGCQAYLESSNPRNISLYQRHGFEALGEIQCGSSPTMIPMLRLPH